MLKLVRNLVLVLVLLSSATVVGSVAAASSDKPTVAGFRILPASLNYIGGSVTSSATVKNATRCIFTSSPAVAGVYKNIACSSGRVSYTAKFPENTSTKNIIYTFKLIVTGKKGEGNVTTPLKTVTVVAAARPAISSFTASNNEFSSAGGNESLTGRVAIVPDMSCNLSASPAIEGTSSNIVPCGQGSAIAEVVMPANGTATDITYTFTLTESGVNGTASKTLNVIVDSNPPTTTTTTTPPTTTTTSPPSTTSGNTVGLPAEPDAFVQAGNNIWVASCSGNAVTEINNTTKKIVDEVNSTLYEFNCPDALAFDGTNIWVANRLGNSITILNASNGSLNRILSGSQILNPNALAFDGTNIWVSDDSQNGSVGSFISEFNASSFGVVRTITTPKNYKYVFGSPDCLALTNSTIWVSDLTNYGALEFNINSGAYIRQTSGTTGTNSSACVTYHSGYIWVSDVDNNVITEYNATTGIYVRKIINIVNPSQVFFTGNDLFVISENPTDSVREYNSSGVFLKTIARSNKNLGKGISAIVLDGSSLWTANYSSNSATKYAL